MEGEDSEANFKKKGQKKEDDKISKDTIVSEDSTQKQRQYTTRKYIRSSMTTRSLVDTVTYVKDKKDGSVGDYLVVHHSHQAENTGSKQNK